MGRLALRVLQNPRGAGPGSSRHEDCGGPRAAGSLVTCFDLMLLKKELIQGDSLDSDL